MGFLRGNVLAWATAVWEIQTMNCSSFSSFVTKMKKMFDHPVWGRDKQGITYFVLDFVLSSVLQLFQTSWSSCPSGISCTLSLMKRHFWWPTMDADTRAYVSAYIVCTCYKTSHRPPFGLLHPLPVINCPWLHIAKCHCTPACNYQLGQRVWLSSSNIPFALQKTHSPIHRVHVRIRQVCNQVKVAQVHPSPLYLPCLSAQASV